MEANINWPVGLYGDGNSSKTIAEALISFCQNYYFVMNG